MIDFKWFNITSEKELRDNYKFNEISEEVLLDLNLKGVIKIKGFSNLYKFIDSIKKFKVKNVEQSDDYFKSEEHKIAFMLLYYDKKFNSELGITQRHFLDKEKAKEWRNKYMKLFHPDKGKKFKDQDQIASAITTIYKRMVGEA
jgi:formyltetrahydrofolate synthetase